MSKIEVSLENNVLKIEKITARKNESNIEYMPIEELIYNREYKSKIRLTNQEDNNKIIFFKVLEENKSDNEKRVVAVYTQDKKIKYIYGDSDRIYQIIYKKMVKLKFKVLKIKLNKKRLKIKVLAYLINPYNVKIENTKFYIDSETYKECTLKQYNTRISKTKMLLDKNVYTFNFKMEDILKDESMINSRIRFELKIDDNIIAYKMAIKKHRIKNRRYYYVPIKSTFVNDFAIHIRRTLYGTLVLVKRLQTPEEKKLSFRIKESKLVSEIFYILGSINKRLNKKPINLYFEKYSSKAEEGTYELFLLANKRNTSHNYFIIDKKSEDYEKIKNGKNVVLKYCLKYYFLIYSSTNFITTEAPMHITELRSNNKILRKNLYDKQFVFLQHGVTYLKRHEANSAYITGREAAPNYIIANSVKEQDIIAEMLNMDESKILITGMPIFSKLSYKHINQSSDNYITIMLTWKPYEEHLYNFVESTYYKNIIEIYNVLKKYVDKEKIIVISHPKVFDLLKSTELGKYQWNKPISKALEKTKLLITDYSSVCYNSFYQGSGVIFYQPDLEIYEKENGELIPNDDEYIGKRAFTLEQLEDIIKDTVTNNKIDLNKVRTKEHEEIYKTINEFSDGKNIERIYNELVRLGYI